MISQKIIEILVNRIQIGGINPSTGQPMRVEDIKIEEYQLAVEKALRQEAV